MKKTPADELLIGAHTSAQGGAYNALLIGKEIGATTVQLFTRNQKQWGGKPITDEEELLFKDTMSSTGLKKIMCHDSYLINLGSPKPEGLEKSRHAFKDELLRCQKLGVTFLNFHPGAALDNTREECLDRIVTSLEELEEVANGDTRLLLETTAGQGSCVGHRFEDLAYIIQRVHTKIPIGVCIDTCHIFAAGYDIRSSQGWDETVQEFDRLIGLKYLHAFHVNDSMNPLGSRKDRHAHLGEGEIGIESFKAMMAHPDLREIPKYLETPEETRWQEEIALLRTFASL